MRFVHIADMHFDMQFKMLSDKIGIGEQRRYDQRVILRKIINYIKENYGQAYLTPLIINKNVEHLKNVLPYLESLGVLPYVVKSASILTLTLDEIKERKDFVESNNDTLVLQNGRFNSIFGVSRANYKKLTNNKNSITK